MNKATETIDRDLRIRQADYTTQELDAIIIELAIELGWRGADARDYRDIRRLLMVANGEARPEFFHSEADEQVIGEHLVWVAEDATSYLNELAPDGCWVGHDGEAGYFGVWTTETQDGGAA